MTRPYQYRFTAQSPQGGRQGGIPIDIETTKYRVCSLRPTDASTHFQSWLADPSVMMPLNMPTRTLALGDLERYISGFDNVGKFLLGLFDRQSNIHFGIVMVEISLQHRLARLAYLIGERRYRGIGALRESLAGLIDHLFTARSIEKIAAHVTTSNTASIAALKALGFVIEGTLRGEIRSSADGGRLDQFTFGLLKSEWRGPSPLS